MSEIQFEAIPEKTKRTIKKRSFWLSRPAAILIVLCFFLPWISGSCSGSPSYPEDYTSGVEFVTKMTPDVSVFYDAPIIDILSTGLIVLFFSFPALGAFVCLLMSIKKDDKWLTIAYALFSITASSMLVALLIIFVPPMQLELQVQELVLFGTIPACTLISWVYLSILRSQNIKVLRRYTIVLILFFGVIFTLYFFRFRNIGSGGLEPAFFLTCIAVISFLISAYLSYKENLPPDKHKRDFQIEL